MQEGEIPMANATRPPGGGNGGNQQPPAGGTFGNGFRVWQSGGGSRNPTDGTMVDQVHFICYPGLRVAAANQFVETVGN